MVKYEIEKPQATIWQIWSPRQGQGRPEKKRRSAIPSKKTPASTVFSSWRIVLPHLEWIAIGQRASFPPSQWRISFASTSCLASRSDRQNGMSESESGSSELRINLYFSGWMLLVMIMVVCHEVLKEDDGGCDIYFTSVF